MPASLRHLCRVCVRRHFVHRERVRVIASSASRKNPRACVNQATPRAYSLPCANAKKHAGVSGRCADIDRPHRIDCVEHLCLEEALQRGLKAFIKPCRVNPRVLPRVVRHELPNRETCACPLRDRSIYLLRFRYTALEPLLYDRLQSISAPLFLTDYIRICAVCERLQLINRHNHLLLIY